MQSPFSKRVACWWKNDLGMIHDHPWPSFWILFGSQSPRVRVFSILGPPICYGHCFLNRRMYPKMEGNIGVISFRRYALRGKSAARMSSFLMEWFPFISRSLSIILNFWNFVFFLRWWEFMVFFCFFLSPKSPVQAQKVWENEVILFQVCDKSSHHVGFACDGPVPGLVRCTKCWRAKSPIDRLKLHLKKDQLAGWIKRWDGEVFLRFGAPVPRFFGKNRDWSADPPCDCDIAVRSCKAIWEIIWDMDSWRSGRPVEIHFWYLPRREAGAIVVFMDSRAGTSSTSTNRRWPFEGKGSSRERRMLCLYFIALVHEKKLGLEKSWNKMRLWCNS